MKLFFIFSSSLLFLFTTQSLAQGLYVTLEGGASMASSKQETTYSFPSDNPWKYRLFNKGTNGKTNLGFGLGVNYGGTIGFMLNQNIGIQLGVSSFSGRDNKNIILPSYSDEEPELLYTTSMMRFIPSILLITGNGSLKPYAKIGVIFGITEIIEKRDYSMQGFAPISSLYPYNSQIYNVKSTKEFSGGLAIGYHAELGIQYSINNKISLIGGLNMISLIYSPEKSSYTKFNIGRKDELASLTTTEKETEYVEEYSGQNLYPYPSPPINNEEPRKELERSFDFGSIGLTTGIMFNF